MEPDETTAASTPPSRLRETKRAAGAPTEPSLAARAAGSPAQQRDSGPEHAEGQGHEPRRADASHGGIRHARPPFRGALLDRKVPHQVVHHRYRLSWIERGS